MLEYRGKLERAIDIHLLGSPVQRLKVFEEECQGLFAPLDLSPVTVVDTPHRWYHILFPCVT
jgi:hypothetical protein